MDTVLQFLLQTNEGEINACVDYTRPSLAIDIQVLKEAFLDAKKRGIKLRYITEIIEDNLGYCKQMMTMVDELRHLDRIKGNFYISDTGYLAPASFHEAGKPAAQIIYSNIKEIIEQQKYVFETLWSKTIPAEQRIREIEEGTIRYETVIIDNSEEIIKEISSLIANSNELDTCLTSGGMHYSHKYFFDIKKKLLDKQKRGEHKGLRYVTNINNENVKLAKLYLDSGIQIKHLNNTPPLSFGVSDKQIALTIEEMEEGNVVQSLLISNDPQYLKHFSTLFQELWKSGVNARERIREIEEGIEPTLIEIIKSPQDAVTLSNDLVKTAKHEILRIYPSINQFRRQVSIGILHLFRDALSHGISVRILVPGDEEQIKEIINEVQLALPQLEIRSLDKSLQTQIGILVVDRKQSMIIELKDDTKDTYYDAAGLATYSNSKPIAVSYASIFELFWNERMLVEELKIADRMQKEFIGIAAHELKTPIQAILGMSSLLKYYPERTDQVIEVIKRNAIRLQRLSTNILDATRIESQTLKLAKERFNICDLVPTIIEDFKERMKDNISNKVELIYVNDVNLKNNNPIIVEADRERIIQVISNLLSNSIQFTNQGYISLEISTNNDGKEAVITVRDTGTGINPEVLSKLFSKFVTRSQKGTGLGLFISKNIIEAHGGRIWAENNVLDGQGTIFYFALPLDTKDRVEEGKGECS
jgi:two-component system, OmpR family, sensor histidine kinase VicK